MEVLEFKGVSSFESAAKELKKIYDSFIDAGFKPEQPLELLKLLIGVGVSK